MKKFVFADPITNKGVLIETKDVSSASIIFNAQVRRITPKNPVRIIEVVREI